jgi:hypothetical protein
VTGLDGLVGAGYEVVIDAELVAGDGSAPSFYGVAPALVLLGVFCDEADGRAPRWAASWTDASGQAGLAARDVPHVPGVDHPHRLDRFLEHPVDRQPRSRTLVCSLPVPINVGWIHRSSRCLWSGSARLPTQ